MYIGMISIQLRSVFGFFQRSAILETNDPK